MKLFDTIRRAVENDGRSLREFSKLIECDVSQLSRFMSGERMMSPARIERLCDLLGLVLVPRARRPKRTAKR